MSDTLTATKSTTGPESGANAAKFIWYELMTSDQDAAILFYKEVVGWSAAEQTMASLDFRYTLLSAGERAVAGLMALTADMRAGGAQPGWVGVIGVPDTDEAARRVVEAGGAVHMGPEDIPNVGRFAFVSDPGGAVFELMTPIPPEQEPTPLPRTAPGNVGWHELYSGTGQEAAFDFYSRLFGWTTVELMDMGPMGQYRLFAAGGDPIGGMMSKPELMPAPAWSFYFVVEGIDAAIERINANGGQVLMGPHEVPDGSWIVQALDPQGAHFALVSQVR